MSNLIKMVNQIVENKANSNEVEQASTSSSSISAHFLRSK